MDADRGKPMTVKHWTRAGLMLTDWCNAACACCYANCGPWGRQWLSVEAALRIWAGLIAAGPHGCRIHLTGGEPFGRVDLLLDVCRAARRRGLGPLESVETNAHWAVHDDDAYAVLCTLDELGMGRLVISADPYHQQFVPIQRVRRLAELARQVLGADRVRVRWADWLAEGTDLPAELDERSRLLLERYAARGRDRLTGRAAEALPVAPPGQPAEAFAGQDCACRLLRGGHVHVAPTGEVWPGTCVGIAIGNALTEPTAEIWRRLERCWAELPVVGPLARGGPSSLLGTPEAAGFAPRAAGYASKCQLCFELRRHIVWTGRAPATDKLAPRSVYESMNPSHSGVGAETPRPVV